MEAIRTSPSNAALDSDHVANAIHSLMSKAAHWEGTPSALLQALDGVVDERIHQTEVLAANPIGSW